MPTNRAPQGRLATGTSLRLAAACLAAALASLAALAAATLVVAPALAQAPPPATAPPTSSASPTPPAPPAPGGAALARADAAWAARATGHAVGSGRALAGPIAAAVAAYREARRAAPENLEVCWKLLRAEHFKGEFVAVERADKQAIFGGARTDAEACLDLAARRAGGRARLDAMAPRAAAQALAGVPEAAALHLWAGIHWALWGDNFGRLAAARQGVGDRVRRYAEIVIAIDERFESAGGHRLLGRLHTLAPKVPFFTGWVDRATAVAELRRAVAIAPEDPLNPVFLADALLRWQPDRVAEARELLRRVLARQPSPEQAVEDEDALRQARQLLAGGSSSS